MNTVTRAIVSGFAWLLSGYAAPAHCTEPVAPDAGEILAALSFPVDVEVAFTQSQMNPLLRRVNRQQGVMSKTADRGLVMTVNTPRPEERRLHDGFATLTRIKGHDRLSERENVTRRKKLDPASPADLALLSLHALMYGDIAILQRHFEFSAAHIAADGWELELVPRADQMQRKLSRLRLAGVGSHLTQFRSERDGAGGRLSHWLEVHIEGPERATKAQAPS